MKKYILIFPLLISFTNIVASPVNHYHGERSHSHNLPNKKIGHIHGNLPTGSLSKSSSEKTIKEEVEEDIHYVRGYVNQSIRTHVLVYFDKNTDLINSRFVRKKNWKVNLEKDCLKLANRIKNTFKKSDVYSYTLNNCKVLTLNRFKSRS